jgi:hypothetical protein
MKPPRARHDFEGFRGPVSPHQHRHDDARARTVGRMSDTSGAFLEKRILALLTESLPRSIKSSFMVFTQRRVPVRLILLELADRLRFERETPACVRPWACFQSGHGKRVRSQG